MRQNELKGDEKMQINKLRAKMVERGVNVTELAKRIGADRSSLYRKFANAEKFTVGEAMKLKAALDISDREAIEIFLR